MDRTAKLAQSTSQYYIDLHCTTRLAPSKYFPVLLCTTKRAQSLHKVVPSTTLYYTKLLHSELLHREALTQKRFPTSSYRLEAFYILYAKKQGFVRFHPHQHHLDEAIPLPAAISALQYNCVDHGNQQHGCSHSNTICTPEFNFSMGDASEIKRGKTGPVAKVPHIAAGRTFYEKTQGFDRFLTLKLMW